MNAEDKHGLTPLHLRVRVVERRGRSSHSDAAGARSKGGCQKQGRADTSASRLPRRKQLGTEEAARMLLAHGANVNAEGEAGWTPLHAAHTRE